MKKIAIGIFLLITHLAGYVYGVSKGSQSAMTEFKQQFIMANASVDIGRYLEFRELALDLRDGNIDHAMCMAEIAASMKLDDIKDCLANSECGTTIRENLLDVAPETLGEAKTEFTYHSNKEGIRSCDKSMKNLKSAAKPAKPWTDPE